MGTRILSGLIGATFAAGAMLFSSAPALAQIEPFATFSSTTNAKDVRLVNSGTSGTRASDATLYTTSTATALTPGATLVDFSFLQPGISDYVSNIVASYTLSASVAKNTPDQLVVTPIGNYLLQGGFSGTMTFLSTTAITVGAPDFSPHTYAAGSNLLTVTFTGAAFGNGTSASLGGSTDGTSSVVFTSDFLDFGNIINADFQTSFTSIAPTLRTGANGALASFRASTGGQFSSDPAPLINGAVPEPASWAMMIAGFAMMGVAVRSRRRTGAALSHG